MGKASPKLRRVELVCLALGTGAGFAVGLSQYFHLSVIVTVVSTVVSVLTLYLGWQGHRARSETAGLALDDVAKKLAERVEREWKREVRLWRLNDPKPISVSWQAVDAELVEEWDQLVLTAKDRPGSNPACWAAGPTGLAGSSGGRGLAWVLSRVPTGRLVVLGEPGAGKTVLLVHLVLDLLKRRPVPVPVLVSLASWRYPAVQDLRTWLVDRLTIDYDGLAEPAPSVTGKINLAEALLDNHLLLPILDGLDELPESVRSQAIDNINSALDPGDGLIVSCRTKEYGQAVNPPEGVKLRDTAGVMVRELDHADVRKYLRDDAGSTPDRWNPVLNNPNSPAGQALRTPLMVWVARTIYNPRPGERTESLPKLDDLRKFPTSTDVERHLFDSFILAAYRPHLKRPCRWLDTDAKRYLVNLAIHLENLSQAPNDTVDFAWWELRDSKELPKHLSGLAVGIVAGLATGLTAGFGANIGAGIGIGLGLGLLLGLVVRWPVQNIPQSTKSTIKRMIKRMTKPTIKRMTKPEVKRMIKPTTKGKTNRNAEAVKYVKGLVGGLMGGIFGGFVAGLVSLIRIGHARGLAGGLPIGLGVGMGIGPTSEFVDGLVGGLVGGFGGGLVGALGVGLAAGLLNGLGVGLTVGLSVDKFSDRRKPARGVTWDKSGLAGGIAVGGMVGVTAWVVAGPTIGIVAGSIASIVAACAVGLIDAPADLNTGVGPRAVLARDRLTFGIFGIVVAIATGLVAGLTVGLVVAMEKSTKEKSAGPSLAFLLRNGTGIALATALVLGLSFAFAKSSWGSFTLARCWLALGHRLPWRLMAFLADAHEQRSVLRKVGAYYQFRHIDLQRHLAKQGEWAVEAVADPAQASGDVGVAGSADHGDG